MTEPKKRGIIFRFFRGLWCTLDISRRVVINLIFLIIVTALIAGFWGEKTTPLQNKTVLVLNLQGELVEEQLADIQTSLLLEDHPLQIQLRDALAVFDAAAQDERVERILLMVDRLEGVGTASMHELAQAMERFKQSGKKIIAWGSNFGQSQYYLAAHADEVYLHPLGSVLLSGFGGDTNYYKDALDKLGVNVNVIHAGAYKNAGEPYTANAPSQETLEATAYVLDDLWQSYTGDIEKARGLAEGAIMELINALPAPLQKAKGSFAQMSVEAGLIDDLKTLDDIRDTFMKELAVTEQGDTFRQIGFLDYLQYLPAPSVGDGIGIIVAEGTIIDGVAPKGSIGGESTAARIRKARTDDSIKALVVRVNSPGGAVLGSELIRQEIAKTRDSGKPVVISMGDLAASGGYWLATGADKIIADPGTITGSIGVLTIMPNVSGLMDKLTIHQGGYKTTWLSDVFDPRQPIDPRFESMLESHIDHIYQQFLGHVATARNTNPAAIHEVAQGRIWTGQQALDRGLVDALGGLNTALQEALQLAKLDDKTPVRYIEPDLTPIEEFLEILGAKATVWLKTALPEELVLAKNSIFQKDIQQLAGLLNQEKPYTILLHCFCEPRID